MRPFLVWAALSVGIMSLATFVAPEATADWPQGLREFIRPFIAVAYITFAMYTLGDHLADRIANGTKEKK